MGNSLNVPKDGEGGPGREGGGFGSYPETRTTPGAPGPFRDDFAPSLGPGAVGRHGYAGVAGSRNAGLGGSGVSAGPRTSAGAAGDAMDVESKADDGEEEEEVRYLRGMEVGLCLRSRAGGGRKKVRQATARIRGRVVATATIAPAGSLAFT